MGHRWTDEKVNASPDECISDFRECLDKCIQRIASEEIFERNTKDGNLLHNISKSVISLKLNRKINLNNDITINIEYKLRWTADAVANRGCNFVNC